MMPLTGSVRTYLRGLAHHLKPSVIVGQHGITESFIHATDQALENHELIKVKFNHFKDHKQMLAPEIAQKTRSELVGLIGNIAIFYRKQPDTAKQKIQFPAPK